MVVVHGVSAAQFAVTKMEQLQGEIKLGDIAIDRFQAMLIIRAGAPANVPKVLKDTYASLLDVPGDGPGWPTNGSKVYRERVVNRAMAKLYYTIKNVEADGVTIKDRKNLFLENLTKEILMCTDHNAWKMEPAANTTHQLVRLRHDEFRDKIRERLLDLRRNKPAFQASVASPTQYDDSTFLEGKIHVMLYRYLS